MLSDAEVLAALGDRLSTQDVVSALHRVLRVPEAWSRLHDPEALNWALDMLGPRLSPGPIVFHTLGLDSNPTSTTRLPEEQESRVRRLWDEARLGAVQVKDAEDVALLAVSLLRHVEQDLAGAAGAIQSQPATWGSALACAWPALSKPADLAARLAKSSDAAVVLAARAALASGDQTTAAATLRQALGSEVTRLVFPLEQRGEHGLALALLSTGAAAKDGESHDVATDPIAQAGRLMMQADFPTAHEVLSQAWEQALEEAAQVADRLTQIAQAEANPIVELEAAQEALRLRTSPDRRARLASALVACHRPDDGLAALSSTFDAPEEKIVAGEAYAAIGDHERATVLLLKAAEVTKTATSLQPSWLTRLAASLHSLGEVQAAVEIATRRVQATPLDVSARTTLAALLNTSGDHQAAADHARLALALSPDQPDARRALAEALQASGLPAAALPHWQALAATEDKALPDLARCALDAGAAEQAQKTAKLMLERVPDSADALVLLGKAHLSSGDIESARATLERAASLEPKCAEAWVALAECQRAAGDDTACGATLASAVQALPYSGELRIAHARWLRQEGRLSEALEATQRAVSNEGRHPEWLVEMGGLLRALGHTDRALPVLREAVSLIPGNLAAKTALAQAYEDKGELAAAVRLVEVLPETAPAESFLNSGRILLKAALAGDRHTLQPALARLERAAAKGVRDPWLECWLGRARELTGEPAVALEHYQRCLKAADEKAPEARLEATLGFGRAASASGQPDVAITALEEARSRFPASTEVLIHLSQAYIAAGLHPQAVEAAEQAAELSPERPEPLEQLSEAARAAGRWPEAVHALEQLCAIRPSEPTARLRLAEAGLEAGDTEAAEQGLAGALHLARSNGGVLRKASLLLHRLGRPSLALRSLRRASELALDDRQALRDLAQTGEAVHDLETARRAWCRLSDLEPDNADTLSRAAHSLWALNRRAAAIGLWQRALALQPDDAALHQAAGRAYLANGETERGLNHLAAAQRLLPEDVDLALEAGLAAMRHGAFQEALETLERASRLAPDRPAPLEAMGECLLHLGRSADARRALDEASKQEPSACGVWALLSMAALDSGDMAGARQTLETALSRKPSSSQEVMRVARAAMRLGSWAKALAAIETPPSDQEDPALLLEAARLRVRLADAHWLFADAAHATAHAPEASLATSEARHTLASLLDRYTASGGTVAVSDGIRLRAAAAFDEASAGLLSSLKPIAAQDASGETKEGMAIALLRAGRLSEAVEVLEQPAVTHTADEWTALLFGLCHAEMGQGEIARQAYAAASANPAIKPLADYLAARTLLAEDNPSEFLTRAGRALLDWDEEPYWHYEIANVYAQQGDQDAALGHLQRAVELAPEEGDYQLALARGYREAGDLEQAKAAYAQVLNGMPAVGSIWKEAGFLAMAAGDVVAAHSWLERAAALLASDPDCLVGMASAASKSGHEREANEHIQAAFRVAPENPAVLLALGEIMAEQGKFEKAIQAYDRAIHRAADPSAARLARSRLLIRVGRPAQAVAEAKAVVEAHPEADHGWAALAEAYEATGELQSAVPAAEQAVKLSPRGASYRLILGRVCRRAGHLDRALDELASAQAAHPRDARLALELGQVYEERRDFKRSLDEYVRAIELDPTSTQAHYRGGLMLKNMKAYTQAGQLLKRAVELNPKDPEALHQLAAVRALELVHGGIPLQAVTS